MLIWGLDVQAFCFGWGEGVSQVVCGCLQIYQGFLGGFLPCCGLLVQGYEEDVVYLREDGVGCCGEVGGGHGRDVSDADEEENWG